MIKLFRKIRRCWFIIMSMIDREFIARTFNIHHPSELKAWDIFNTTLRKDYDEYCSVRDELRKWHWMMRKYGCQTIQEFENQVDFLCKSRSPADQQYVDEWFRFKKMF